MGTSAGPRIDDRLRRFIEGSPEHAAEVTRCVGALAWDLLLPRPSYQQVRVLLNASRGAGRPARRPATRGLPRRRPARMAVSTGRAAMPHLAASVSPARRSAARLAAAGSAVNRLVVPGTELRVLDLIGRLWEYPGPGLADWYERYKHGRL